MLLNACPSSWNPNLHSTLVRFLYSTSSHFTLQLWLHTITAIPPAWAELQTSRVLTNLEWSLNWKSPLDYWRNSAITSMVDSWYLPFERVDHISLVSPNGIMYVKPCVRKGLLSRMLVELLDTRVMVKQAMKRVGGDKVSFQRVEISQSYKNTPFRSGNRSLMPDNSVWSTSRMLLTGTLVLHFLEGCQLLKLLTASFRVDEKLSRRSENLRSKHEFTN